MGYRDNPETLRCENAENGPKLRGLWWTPEVGNLPRSIGSSGQAVKHPIVPGYSMTYAATRGFEKFDCPCNVSPIHWRLRIRKSNWSTRKVPHLPVWRNLEELLVETHLPVGHCWWAQGLVHVLRVVGFWCPCTEVWSKLSSPRSMTAGES